VASMRAEAEAVSAKFQKIFLALCSFLCKIHLDIGRKIGYSNLQAKRKGVRRSK
jgi:hypothetical protein